MITNWFKTLSTESSTSFPTVRFLSENRFNSSKFSDRFAKEAPALGATCAWCRQTPDSFRPLQKDVCYSINYTSPDETKQPTPTSKHFKLETTRPDCHRRLGAIQQQMALTQRPQTTPASCTCELQHQSFITISLLASWNLFTIKINVHMDKQFLKLKRCNRQNHQFPGYSWTSTICLFISTIYIYVYILAGRENCQSGQNAHWWRSQNICPLHTTCSNTPTQPPLLSPSHCFTSTR